MLDKKIFYPFIAGVFDLFFAGILINTLLAIYGSLTQSALHLLLSIFTLPLTFIIIFVYYWFITPQTKTLTPGEMIVGRKIIFDDTLDFDEKFGFYCKRWTNPYGANRWALFLLTYVVLAVGESSWDALSAGYIYSLGTVASKSLLLLLLSYGVVGVGQGRVKSTWFVIIYFVLLLRQILATPVSGVENEVIDMIAYGYLGIGALYALVALMYSSTIGGESWKPAEATG